MPSVESYCSKRAAEGAHDSRTRLPPLSIALQVGGRDCNYRTEPQPALDG
jgi:hypothetical protein